MKKLILLAILVLTFALSGCGKVDTTKRDECIDNGGDWNAYPYIGKSDGACNYETENPYYTQEEVDELIIDLQLEFSNLLLEYYVMYDRENELLISMCYVEGMQKQCDFSLEIEELQERESLDNGMIVILATRIDELEQRIEPLEVCPTEQLPAMSTEEFRAYLLVEYPDLAPYFRFNEEELE